MLAPGYGESNSRPVAPLGGASCKLNRFGRSAASRGAVDERREAGSGSLPEWRCRWPSASGTATVSWSTAARLLVSRAKARPSGGQRGEACIDTRMCKRLLASCRGMLRVRGPPGARRGVDGVMEHPAERPPEPVLVRLSDRWCAPGNRSDGLLRKRWRPPGRHRTLYCKHSPLRRMCVAFARARPASASV